MMKKAFLLSLLPAAVSLFAGTGMIRPVFQAAAGKPAANAAPCYPFFVRCSVIEEFSLFPGEGGKAAFFLDEKHLYVSAVLEDSEVICQAPADGGRLDQTGDCLMILLKEESSPLLWEYLISPAGRISAFCTSGRETHGAPLPFAQQSLAIDGRINDGNRDASWSVTVAIPLEEFRRRGLKFDRSERWLIQIQRVNFSRFIPKREVSGAPQNHGDPYETDLYARLLLPGERPDEFFVKK